jgi:hypothetical protein
VRPSQVLLWQEGAARGLRNPLKKATGFTEALAQVRGAALRPRGGDPQNSVAVCLWLRARVMRQLM